MRDVKLSNGGLQMDEDKRGLGETTSVEGDETKLPYRSPELRRLGSLAEVTQFTGTPGGNTDAETEYTTS